MKSDPSSYTEIVDGAKYHVHPNGSLSIVDAQKTDDGTYKVEISNSVGTVTEEIQVELMELKGQSLSLEIKIFLEVNMQISFNYLV